MVNACMPNNYFQFKQFTVYQDKCAMKVTTDGCLFGAYVNNTIQHCTTNIAHTLDIGAGTGLLSLMIAQANSFLIDAVEIDANAYEQAEDNFDRSPWKERLTVFNSDILEFQSAIKYDCIISNPPFFEDDLRSDNEQKNKAKHDSSLTLQALIKVVENKLSVDGIFFVLLPYHRIHYFETEANKMGLYPEEKLLVKQTSTHDFFRGCLSFSRKKKQTVTSQLTIKNSEGNYTDEFILLMKDYYLHL